MIGNGMPKSGPVAATTGSSTDNNIISANGMAMTSNGETAPLVNLQEDPASSSSASHSLHLGSCRSNDSSPDSLLASLHLSFAKLKNNLAHNRAVFVAKADAVMAKIKEMEQQVQKAIDGLEGSTSTPDLHGGAVDESGAVLPAKRIAASEHDDNDLTLPAAMTH